MTKLLCCEEVGKTADASWLPVAWIKTPEMLEVHLVKYVVRLRSRLRLAELALESGDLDHLDKLLNELAVIAMRGGFTGLARKSRKISAHDMCRNRQAIHVGMQGLAAEFAALREFYQKKLAFLRHEF